jgi:hypothetical protein
MYETNVNERPSKPNYAYDIKDAENKGGFANVCMHSTANLHLHLQAMAQIHLHLQNATHRKTPLNEPTTSTKPLAI